MRYQLSQEFLIYWGLNVCLSVTKWNTMSADPRVSHLLRTKCVSVWTKWNTMSTDHRVFSATDSPRKHLLQTVCNYIFLIIITLNLSNICCIQQSHLYIYLHGHYNSESFQYMLYTIYKKIELHNYINNGYIEDGVSPHFFNLPPSLILLMLKILRLFIFKLKLRKKFVKRDITWWIYSFLLAKKYVNTNYWGLLKHFKGKPFLEKGKLNNTFKWYLVLFIFTRVIFQKFINILFIDIQWFVLWEW